MLQLISKKRSIKTSKITLITTAVLTMLTTACQTIESTDTEVESNKPHNIIYLIGDGMGVSHTTAYRYYKANSEGKVRGDKNVIAPTHFDNILVGMASTYPADDTLVTDSAASATALATGYKSFNGAIGETPDHLAKETLLERAQKLGMLTGIVSTSQINHATPASFIAHIDSRHKLNEIADQYVDGHQSDDSDIHKNVDLMLGGGTQYFSRDNRNIVAEYQQDGFSFIDDMAALATLKTLPALGLFAAKGLPFAIDHQQPNRLTRMSETALRLMANQTQGFFLMLEGSQIDWCSHSNDIACAMAEMTDFEKTLELVLAFAEKDGNTTVVVTADHTTGGLALGQGGHYAWHAELVHKIHISGDNFAKQVTEGKNAVALWQSKVDLPLTEDEMKMLQVAEKSNDKRQIQKTFVTLTSMKTGTGWTSTGHSGEDVQVFAFGPFSDQFIGFQDNTDIAKRLFDIIELNK